MRKPCDQASISLGLSSQLEHILLASKPGGVSQRKKLIRKPTAEKSATSRLKRLNKSIRKPQKPLTATTSKLTFSKN